MKEYSRPKIETSAIDCINEPVYLGGSNDPWQDSDCYVTSVTGRQGVDLGRNSFTVQVDALHVAGREAYQNAHPTWANHHNDHQVLIFVFNKPIPAGVTATINGLPGEFNADRTRLRTTQYYHQNDNDRIGSGGFFIEWNGLDPWTNEKEMLEYFPVDFDANDVFYRHMNHNDCQ